MSRARLHAEMNAGACSQADILVRRHMWRTPHHRAGFAREMSAPAALVMGAGPRTTGRPGGHIPENHIKIPNFSSHFSYFVSFFIAFGHIRKKQEKVPKIPIILGTSSYFFDIYPRRHIYSAKMPCPRRQSAHATA